MSTLRAKKGFSMEHLASMGISRAEVRLRVTVLSLQLGFGV